MATWTSLPEYDQIEVARHGVSNDTSRFVTHASRLSRAFTTSTDATTATLDFAHVPGFRPEWRCDPKAERFFELEASRGPPLDGRAFSVVSEAIPAPTASDTGPTRVDPQRATALINAHRARLQHLHMAARPGAR